MQGLYVVKYYSYVATYSIVALRLWYVPSYDDTVYYYVQRYVSLNNVNIL